MTRLIEAAILDLDGVLVDTEPWWFDARRRVMESRGAAWTAEDEASVKGRNSHEWAAVLADRLGSDDAASVERVVIEAMLERYGRERPPVIEAGLRGLERLAGRLPLAIASSAPPEVIRAALQTLGVRDRFRALVSSDEVEAGKPDPAVYLEAARRLGVEPTRCLVVEDSDAGVAAGLAAGMRVVHVPAPGHPAGEGSGHAATLTLESLDDLDEARLRALEDDDAGASGPAEGAERSNGPPDDPVDRLQPPEARVAAWRRTVRYHATRIAVSLAVRCIVRLRVERLERLPPGPALLCFNHQSWVDPFVAIAALPAHPRLYWFGPREEDMSVGGRNRLMLWVGTAVPFKPAKTDLRETTRRVQAVFDAGYRLGIYGEGRIHALEGELLPLQEGAVFFAMRSGVPIVPVGILGTSWLGFGRTVRVRVGEPIATNGRRGREAMAELTAATWCALFDLVQGYPERPPPGRFGRWLTELFNEWPGGTRPDRTEGATGPRRPGPPVAGPHGPCPDGDRV